MTLEYIVDTSVDLMNDCLLYYPVSIFQTCWNLRCRVTGIFLGSAGSWPWGWNLLLLFHRPLFLHQHSVIIFYMPACYTAFATLYEVRSIINFSYPLDRKLFSLTWVIIWNLLYLVYFWNCLIHYLLSFYEYKCISKSLFLPLKPGKYLDTPDNS